jgi:hypothetical protein
MSLKLSEVRECQPLFCKGRWHKNLNEAIDSSCGCYSEVQLSMSELEEENKWLNVAQRASYNTVLLTYPDTYLSIILFNVSHFKRFLFPKYKIISPALTRLQATSPTHTFRTADLDLAHTSPSYTNDLYSHAILLMMGEYSARNM